MLTQLAVEAGTDAKMKIAQITPYFLPVEGGVERHVLNLSHELVRRGHEVEIFTCARTRQNEPLERTSVVQGLRVSRFESMFSIGEFGRVWPGFARKVISLTDEEAGLLARLGVRSDQRAVIPHGVDAIHFSRADPSLFTSKFGLEGRDIALCLSRINRTKGLDVLLEAFAR